MSRPVIIQSLLQTSPFLAKNYVEEINQLTTRQLTNLMDILDEQGVDDAVTALFWFNH